MFIGPQLVHLVTIMIITEKERVVIIIIIIIIINNNPHATALTTHPLPEAGY